MEIIRSIAFSKKAEKTYKKLPKAIKIKADKQLILLIKNFKHPSLHAKKLQGTIMYEARIDYHYRLIYTIEKIGIRIHALGPHDEGLGKK